jgi:hypothetical protein
MLKNEDDLLNTVLPIWSKYPVEQFVFYDDNSTDDSLSTIAKHLPKDRYKIINDKLDSFNESHNRSRMLEYSRDCNVDYVFTIDCDELLSANFEGIFDDVLKNYESYNFLLYWYNVVNGSLQQYRNDAAYVHNYRSFILPMKYTGKFDTSLAKYHVPRTPHVNLPTSITDEIGVLHLQSIDRKYYALKQLWYKHYEYVHYGYSAQEINNKYDSVVNNLMFEEKQTPDDIIRNIEIDMSIFENMADKKGYTQFIKKHYNKDLVTFGHEYI